MALKVLSPRMVSLSSEVTVTHHTPPAPRLRLL